jgi:MFS family permease
MYLQPSESLTDQQIQSGLKSIIADGMFAEAMIALTGGTFLVAMAVSLGATNSQLGILAALPMFSNIFQLLSIWLVKKYNNRRGVTVLTNILGRIPLFLIAALPFLFSTGSSVQALIFLLFFHYVFGAVAGPSWNSWIKDLVPEKQLGTYFSRRGRLTQSLSVIVTLLLALILDFVKEHYPDYELLTYAGMFAAGGIFGMMGVYALAKTPEPRSNLMDEDFFRLLRKPLLNKNYRNLLVFNSCWAFALNMATPFLGVYMMETLRLSLSWIIGMGILGQLSGIVCIKMWGRYSDRFSNKTILHICAPVYVVCIIGWAFSGNVGQAHLIPVLVLINIISGAAVSGINLALNNIGLKLAPKQEAISYITAKNMVVAAISAIAPVAGGLMADFFSKQQFIWDIKWKGTAETYTVQLVNLQGWGFFFIIGGILALISLRLLPAVKENGEVQRDRVVFYMRTKFTRNISKEVKRSMGYETAGVKAAKRKKVLDAA